APLTEPCRQLSRTALHFHTAFAATAATAVNAATTAPSATAATAVPATMASPTVLTFDAEGRAVDFDVWVDDLQLFLQSAPLTEPCRQLSRTALHFHTAFAATAATAVNAATTAPSATAATAVPATMASPTVLTFDAEGRAVDFDVWVDDLQLFLQCDSRDGVSLFDHTSGVSTAPAATANSMVRSQWTTRNAVARLTVRSHLPLAEHAHFGQYKTAQSLYAAVVVRYSSPATAALSRLMLPYLFPDLAAFATVADLVAHLHTSDARYRTALPIEFCAKNPPPMYITLYYLVTRFPDSLSSVRDHFLSLCPTELTVDLLEERLDAAEKSILVLLLSTSLALRRSELRLPLVGDAASARARGARVVAGAAVEAVEEVEEAEGVAVEVRVVPRVGAPVAAVEVVEAAAAVVEVAAAVVLVEVQPRSVETLVVASASSSRAPVRPRRPSSFVSGTLGVGGLGVLVPALTVPSRRRRPRPMVVSEVRRADVELVVVAAAVEVVATATEVVEVAAVTSGWETPHQQGQGEQGWWRGRRWRQWRRWRRRRGWRCRCGWYLEWGLQWRRWRWWRQRQRWWRWRRRWCWSRCSRAAWRLWWSGGAGPCTYVLCTGSRRGEACGLPHTTQRCFDRLTDTWRTQFPDAVELPRWHDLLLQNVPIFDLDFDAIFAAIYALIDSAEGDCYLSVPPNPRIAAAALGASASAAPGTGESTAPGTGESALSGTAPTKALHTFTLDSGALRSFFRDSTTLTPLIRPVAVSLADPSWGPVLAHSSTVLPCPAAPSGLLSGLHLPSFSTNLVSGADLQDAWVDQFTLGGQRVAHCTCSRTGCHLATFTRRPGSSLYTLTTAPPPVSVSGQAAVPSQVFAAASRSRPAPTCVPCVEGWQRAAPHSSTFPPTEAPLQTLHMDVKGEVLEVLIDWIRGARRQLSESLGSDLPVLRLHSDRGGEFSSDLLRAFCRAEGIRQTFTLPASPQQNGIAERRIGMVMDVARTSMIHAAAPHFLWPFAVQYAAHQINLQPRVSLPETTPTLRWTGKVSDASAFRVWGSRAFVRDTSADKLSSHAIACVFLGFPRNTPGWQFYHPTLHLVLSSQDVTFDEPC
ncbi:unnamed protein product, partial [Closterium sp. NIES-53]